MTPTEKSKANSKFLCVYEPHLLLNLQTTNAFHYTFERLSEIFLEFLLEFLSRTLLAKHENNVIPIHLTQTGMAQWLAS